MILCLDQESKVNLICGAQKVVGPAMPEGGGPVLDQPNTLSAHKGFPYTPCGQSAPACTTTAVKIYEISSK